MAYNSENLNSIVLFCTYFGHWPRWAPAYFLSCAKNPDINWVFITDCGIPNLSYPNLKFIDMNLEAFNQKVSQKLGFQVQKNYFSQCDYRPAYGVIFEDEITGFDFWGHCDLDQIFGSIRTFCLDDRLNKYEIISSKNQIIAGHFTIWKNKPEINHLYSKIPDFKKIFSHPGTFYFDEKLISALIHQLQNGEQIGYIPKVFWHHPDREEHVDWQELEAQLKKSWKWTQGRLYDPEGQERFYIHFMTWKYCMRCLDFDWGDEPNSFLFSRQGIWTQKKTFSAQFLNTLPLDWYLRKFWLKHPLLNKLRKIKKAIWLKLGLKTKTKMPPEYR